MTPSEGVGADDTFIVVRCWRLQRKSDPNVVSAEERLQRRLEATIKQSATSMTVTSVTTAVAFFASYISSITAIKCFRYVIKQSMIFAIITVLNTKKLYLQLMLNVNGIGDLLDVNHIVNVIIYHNVGIII